MKKIEVCKRCKKTGALINIPLEMSKYCMRCVLQNERSRILRHADGPIDRLDDPYHQPRSNKRI